MSARHPNGIAAALVLVLLALAGCSSPLNYTNPDGPRYAGLGNNTDLSWNPRTGERVANSPAAEAIADTVLNLRSPHELRIVSFNIKFSNQIDAAISVLQTEPSLLEADVVLLQEMDAPGARRVAEALGAWWVYYPATISPQAEKPFGNAILSRYPIVEDYKLQLPNLGRFAKTMRIATAATLDVHGTPVRVYSVHLATQVELGPASRREQAEAVIADAERFPGPVLIGGDMNAKGLGELFSKAGFHWVTEDLGKTTPFGAIDHFFLKRLEPVFDTSYGKIVDAGIASDHVPIWIRLKNPAPDTAKPARRSNR
jgi:endonuclease/exonuclease/phosphatase family metal-dependent hydrolase